MNIICYNRVALRKHIVPLEAQLGQQNYYVTFHTFHSALN